MHRWQGITVNGIGPGYMKTDNTAALQVKHPDSYDSEACDTTVLQALCRRCDVHTAAPHSMRRVMTPHVQHHRTGVLMAPYAQHHPTGRYSSGATD